MKIAFPAIGRSIAPQLEETSMFFLYDVDACYVLSEKTFFPLRRDLAQEMKDEGVDLVICRNLHNRTAFSLRQKRIELIPGAHGPVKEVLLRYLSGESIGLEEQ